MGRDKKNKPREGETMGRRGDRSTNADNKNNNSLHKNRGDLGKTPRSMGNEGERGQRFQRVGSFREDIGLKIPTLEEKSADKGLVSSRSIRSYRPQGENGVFGRRPRDCCV